MPSVSRPSVIDPKGLASTYAFDPLKTNGLGDQTTEYVWDDDGRPLAQNANGNVTSINGAGYGCDALDRDPFTALSRALLLPS